MSISCSWSHIWWSLFTGIHSTFSPQLFIEMLMQTDCTVGLVNTTRGQNCTLDWCCEKRIYLRRCKPDYLIILPVYLFIHPLSLHQHSPSIPHRKTNTSLWCVYYSTAGWGSMEPTSAAGGVSTIRRKHPYSKNSQRLCSVSQHHLLDIQKGSHSCHCTRDFLGICSPVQL